jgi:hypothetical protein
MLHAYAFPGFQGSVLAKAEKKEKKIYVVFSFRKTRSAEEKSAQLSGAVIYLDGRG